MHLIMTSAGYDNEGTAELQTANVANFLKKNPIIRIFCISLVSRCPNNPGKWSPTVLQQRNL
jgi:hypothetical protein